MAMIKELQEYCTRLFDGAYNLESFIRTFGKKMHTETHRELNMVPIMVKRNTRFWD